MEFGAAEEVKYRRMRAFSTLQFQKTTFWNIQNTKLGFNRSRKLFPKETICMNVSSFFFLRKIPKKTRKALPLCRLLNLPIEK